MQSTSTFSMTRISSLVTESLETSGDLTIFSFFKKTEAFKSYDTYIRIRILEIDKIKGDGCLLEKKYVVGQSGMI